MPDYSKFQRGTGVFTCGCCGRKTRETQDTSGSDMCGICYELSGIQNSLRDDGAEAWMITHRDRLIKKYAGKADMAMVAKMIPTLITLKAEEIAK